MQYTGSVSKGMAAPVHNRRECRVDNADPARKADNVVIHDEDLGALYERVFGEARRAYNEAQVAKGHAERQVKDYLAKVEADKQLQAVHELVVAVGNMDSHPDKGLAERVYRSWLAAFAARYGEHFAVAQAIIHNDEAVPHMHVEVVPVADSKRGLTRQNSLNKALKQSGHETMIDMYAELQLMLEAAMAEHGITRIEGDKSKQLGGVSMAAYKRIKAAEAKAAELEEQVIAKEGHRRLESVIDNPLKSPPEVARFAREAREAEKAAGELASEVERLRAQFRASERRESELRADVRGLRRACRDARGVVERLLAAAGDLTLRVSDAWRDSALGRAVIGLLDGHSHELGVTTSYVPGGIELRGVDGQLQRLREAARQQRGQRQHDIQRGQRPTQTR